MDISSNRSKKFSVEKFFIYKVMYPESVPVTKGGYFKTQTCVI